MNNSTGNRDYSIMFLLLSNQFVHILLCEMSMLGVASVVLSRDTSVKHLLLQKEINSLSTSCEIHVDSV